MNKVSSFTRHMSSYLIPTSIRLGKRERIAHSYPLHSLLVDTEGQLIYSSVFEAMSDGVNSTYNRASLQSMANPSTEQKEYEKVMKALSAFRIPSANTAGGSKGGKAPSSRSKAMVIRRK